MKNLASKYSKISGGDTPGPSQREEATHSRTQHPAHLWLGTGRNRPSVGTQTLVPLNFSAVAAHLYRGLKLQVLFLIIMQMMIYDM